LKQRRERHKHAERALPARQLCAQMIWRSHRRTILGRVKRKTSACPGWAHQR
jgi:hypothetical protein